jgi:hypothetical protein
MSQFFLYFNLMRFDCAVEFKFDGKYKEYELKVIIMHHWAFVNFVAS